MSGNDEAALSVDPSSTEFAQCPYEFYSELRQKAPVYRVPHAGYYIVSTYELVQQVLGKPDVFLNDVRGDVVKTAELKAVYLPTPTLSQCDPPLHAHYRRLVDRVLSPARVNALQPHIQQLVDGLIDAFIDNGRAELYREFAVPLPLTLMADLLAGSRAELERFKRWSSALVLPTQGVLSVEEEREVARLALEFNEYFLAIFHSRRANPTDDLISVLATASIEDRPGGRPLSDDEFVSIIQQLLTGGNETSSSAICAAVLILIRNPQVLQDLRTSPALLEPFIEEVLRLESPIQGLWRRVKDDTTLGDVQLPAGSLLNIRFGAANRDASKFASAERLDLSRHNVHQHLSFGGGIHSCVGRLLIKKELKCALTSIINRLEEMRLEEGARLEYRRAFLERSLQALPITFTKRSGAPHV